MEESYNLSQIAGVVYLSPFQMADFIHPMLASLASAKNFSSSVTLVDSIQLGCVGKKVSINHDKTLYLALDGWIEDTFPLKKALGIPNNTLSHPQLILALYEKFGIKSFEYLRGEFAFALVDKRRGTLFLVRDPIGKKPLYWYHDHQLFLFSSELKSLLATGAIPPTPAADALAAYLYLGFIPQDMSPIKGVNKLLPAHYLQLNNEKSKKIAPYWSYSNYFSTSTSFKSSQAAEELRSRFSLCVKARTDTSSKPTCFLGGGIGSAITAKFLSESVTSQAFTPYFEGETEEDLKAAQMAAEALHMPHHPLLLTPADLIEELPKILWHLDAPVGHPYILSTWQISKEASKTSTCLFSGTGADELFAAHSRYSLTERNPDPLSRLNLIPGRVLTNFVIPFFLKFYPTAAFNLLRALRTNPRQFEYMRSTLLLDEEEIRRLTPKWADAFFPEVLLHQFYSLNQIRSTTASLTYLDVKLRLPELFLIPCERLARAWGLVWHTPFLDRHILELTAGLPEPENLQEHETAFFLKQLSQGSFPSDFLNRPKKTRKHFLSKWAHHPELAALFKRLEKGYLVETGALSEKALRAYTKSPQTMEAAFSPLFAILCLETWFKLFIESANYNHPPEKNLIDLHA